MIQGKNEVLLEGAAAAPPELSHENHGTRFYRILLQVPRLSGTPDLLPVLAEEALLPQMTAGTHIRLRGQLRSYNSRAAGGRRLVLSVYVQSLLPPAGEACNRILLSGSLCKLPTFRRTPLGRSICDLMLAVPRRGGRADYLPVIAWGQLAAEAAALTVGDSLSLEGRVQSRIYRKITDTGVEERTAYEVSVMRFLSDGEAWEE